MDVGRRFYRHPPPGKRENETKNDEESTLTILRNFFFGKPLKERIADSVKEAKAAGERLKQDDREVVIDLETAKDDYQDALRRRDNIHATQLKRLIGQHNKRRQRITYAMNQLNTLISTLQHIESEVDVARAFRQCESCLKQANASVGMNNIAAVSNSFMKNSSLFQTAFNVMTGIADDALEAIDDDVADVEISDDEEVKEALAVAEMEENSNLLAQAPSPNSTDSLLSRRINALHRDSNQ